MKILIYSLNFHPEIIGIGKYCGEMADWLKNNGYDVHVITAYPYYPSWKISNSYSKYLWSIEFINGVKVYRCPLWVPNNPTAIKRLIHLFTFTLTSFPVLFFHFFWKPNIVFITEPPLFCAPSVIIFSKLLRCKAWLHIQDFEIDAAFEAKILNGKFLKKFCLFFERFLFKGFDVVSTISNQMLVKLISKGCPKSKTFLFQNWIHLAPFEKCYANFFDYKKFLLIPDDSILAVYSGSIGTKQGLNLLANVASISQQNGRINNRTIHFLFCGDGAGKGDLVNACANLSNVSFIELQPLVKLPSLLMSADVHLLPQLGGLGDLVMPSKLSGMLASGRPVIATAHPNSEIANIVHKCGFVVDPGDAYAFYSALVKLVSSDSLRSEFGRSAKDYATKYLERDNILHLFQNRIHQIL